MKPFVWLLLCFLSACVLDDTGHTDPELAELTLEASTGTSITTLDDGEQVVLSASAGMKYFKIGVPAGYDYFQVTLAGNYTTGAELYVKRGSLPSTTSYDCRATTGSPFRCSYTMPAGATYYIMVRATTGYTNRTLEATYWNKYIPMTNQYSYQLTLPWGADMFFKLGVPSDARSLAFRMALQEGDDGWIEMYVKRGAFASSTSYDCKRVITPYETTTVGTCAWSQPPAGTYYVALVPKRRSTGTLTGSYHMPFVYAY